jgi:hypothetical protein
LSQRFIHQLPVSLIGGNSDTIPIVTIEYRADAAHCVIDRIGQASNSERE